MISDQQLPKSHELLRSEPLLPVSSNVLSGVRVFLAEDEEMLSWALEEVLNEIGCQVVGTAKRVSEALTFVEENSFDVAVLDATLADGAIDPVVSYLIRRGTPVIIASGAAAVDCTERFGNVLAIQKPFNEAALHQALLRAISQAQLEPTTEL